jgi:hypothetical protein
MMINTPEGIDTFRTLAIKGALQLEVLGMRGRMPAYKLAKEIVTGAGMKPAGSKAGVLAQLETILDGQGA